MTRRRLVHLKLAQVDLLALLAVLGSFVLCACGAISGEACLAFVAGVAVQGRTPSSEPT